MMIAYATAVAAGDLQRSWSARWSSLSSSEAAYVRLRASQVTERSRGALAASGALGGAGAGGVAVVPVHGDGSTGDVGFARLSLMAGLARGCEARPSPDVDEEPSVA